MDGGGSNTTYKSFKISVERSHHLIIRSKISIRLKKDDFFSFK